MKPSDPDWYVRLESGPFARKTFTEELMQKIERKMRSGPRVRAWRLALWSGAAAVAVGGLIFYAALSSGIKGLIAPQLAATSNVKENDPTPEPTPDTKLTMQEALVLAKKRVPDTEAVWNGIVKEKSWQVKPGSPELHTVWMMTGTYPAGNQTVVTIDDVTGEVVNQQQTESPAIGEEGNRYAFSGFRSFDMIDANNGWAISASGVLRTEDGGASWSNVTPPDIPERGELSPILWASTMDAAFLDHRIAVLTFSSHSSGQVTVFRTVDGGMRWESASVPVNSVSARGSELNVGSADSLVFPDRSNGYFKINHPIFDGKSEAVEVYRTTDGGATWRQTAAASGDRDGSIPFEGFKQGMIFLNADTGWISVNSSNGTTLLKTNDAGQHWETLLNIPKENAPAGGYVSFGIPKFISENRGFMPVFTGGAGPQDQTTVRLFSITDGENWHPSGPIEYLSPGSGMAWTFADGVHGYATDGEKWVVTADGGETWQPVESDLSWITGEAKLQFLDAMTGFAADEGALKKTTDGGRTWTLVRPVLK